jgi:glycosyltransferase involved in cell wall biosynthesis
VVIRTRDSSRTLERVLAGLEKSDGDEIIVVDSGSHDSTLKIAQQYNASIIIAHGPFNYSKSLNLGFSAARNPWVLVLSSHAIPIVPKFMEIHREAVKTFSADVVVGYAPGDMDRSVQLSEKGEDVVFYSKKDWAKINQICGNANTIYRRSAWVEWPFDETIRTAEDKIWMIEMAKKNYRFATIPRARALNQNQGSLRYMFRKGFSDRRALNTWTSKWMLLNSPQDAGSVPAIQPKPMTVWQLGGALKSHLMLRLSGRINNGNWIRYSAHILGTFFGSYGTKDNIPNK